MKLNEELKNEKEKTKKLSKELNLEKDKNLKLNKELNSYMNKVNKFSLKLNSIQSDLDLKNKDLQKLKNELKNYKQKIIVTHFISNDENINYSIVCNNNDTFKQIEEELFKEYPDYKDMDYYFFIDGNIINRLKSIKENNIKNHSHIILNIINKKNN